MRWVFESMFENHSSFLPLILQGDDTQLRGRLQAMPPTDSKEVANERTIIMMLWTYIVAQKRTQNQSLTLLFISVRLSIVPWAHQRSIQKVCTKMSFDGASTPWPSL
jgi:hypothetical protein